MTCFCSYLTPLAILVAVLTPVTTYADDQDVIDYREHIMKSMGEQAAAIGQILEQKAPAENLATHIQILMIVEATAKRAFEPNVPGGRAKPEVWTKWAEFSKRLDELTANTEDLSKIAKTGGAAAIAPRIQAALTCKGCHDAFREPEK
jgi:cytochrome c556